MGRRLLHVMMQFDQPVIAELEREKYQIPAPTSSGLGIIGISGAGKSTGITRILNIYPQIISGVIRFGRSWAIPKDAIRNS